jgi:hypothetical protein
MKKKYRKGYIIALLFSLLPSQFYPPDAPASILTLFLFIYGAGVEKVHYYCGNLLVYCTRLR